MPQQRLKLQIYIKMRFLDVLFSLKIIVLKYVRDYVKFYILKMVHSSIVLPHMDHASIVWGRCPNMVNNDRISKLQKRSARAILRCKIRDISSKDLFNTMN